MFDSFAQRALWLISKIGRDIHTPSGRDFGDGDRFICASLLGVHVRRLLANSASCSAILTVPELEPKMTVLNVLASAHSRWSHKHSIEKFIAWHRSDLRLRFYRSIVVRYHLSAMRRLASAVTSWTVPSIKFGSALVFHIVGHSGSV